METKPGYSEWVPNLYQATLRKITVIPTDDGSQEYQVVMVIPRNQATRDLGDFVGQPVMVAIKSVQMPLPLPAAAKKPKVDRKTGEVLEESSVTLSAGGRSVTVQADDLVAAANVSGFQEDA